MQLRFRYVGGCGDHDRRRRAVAPEAPDLHRESRFGQIPSSQPSASTQSFAPAKGGGTLEDARGADHLTLNGSRSPARSDIFGTSARHQGARARRGRGYAWSAASERRTHTGS